MFELNRFQVFPSIDLEGAQGSSSLAVLPSVDDSLIRGWDYIPSF